MIAVVQVGAVKIYVSSSGGIPKSVPGGQNRMKLSLPPKNGAFLSFTPLKNIFLSDVFFCRFYFKSHPVMGQTQESVFSLLYGKF
jgi:hypothetical protein